VDELWRNICPQTPGIGKSLFEDGTYPAASALIESSVTPSGLVSANYKRAGEVKTGIVGAYRENKMRKLIAAINLTLDGFCDHTATDADDEILQHYNELLLDADTLVYGRITYQLMESYWPTIIKDPTGNKPTDEFAVLIDNISKVVFSRTLKNVNWKNVTLAKGSIKEEVLKLKQQTGKNIIAGSPGLIVTLMQLDLIDEYQLCVWPIILGNGLRLFKNINDRINLKLIKTKTFGSGPITLYYEPVKKTESMI
jgi:dihydrofolate reductase